MSFHGLASPTHRKNQQTDGLLPQRKCACDTHSGEPACEDCKKKPKLQRSDRKHVGPLGSPRHADLDRSSAFTQDLSGVATHSSAAAPRWIQRQPLASTPTTGFEPSAQSSAPAPTPEVVPDPTGPTQPATLVVDDAATDPRPGQLRKTDFLNRLQPAVRAAADAALAGTDRSTADCPYLTSWFDRYRGQSSEHVENALRRYAPEARNARTAAEYVPIVAARVRQGVERWASTGELTGVPEGTVAPVGGVAGSVIGAFSGLGNMLFKARGGGARPSDDPTAVRARLGAGSPLDSGTRGRMEGAFGQGFAHVRVHTDATAARLSGDQNARAFTIGHDIAFGAAEFRPGTLVGDALLAHELAHVVQQGDRGTAVAPMATGSTTYDELEESADRAAVGAVASLWAHTRDGFANLTENAIPRARSGLRIQRCRSDTPTHVPKTDLPSVCDDAACLARSGCEAEECKAEAKTITETYVKRVNAIRRPEIPNRGDRHWGWLCYEWAGLLTREFEKLKLKCWQIRWVGIVNSAGSLEHNYIFTSLGPAEGTHGPDRTCGMVLDPWRTGNPVVYGGEWDWHKWNYIHDAKTDRGRVYEHGKWTDVTYPGPWTPPEPTPRTP